MISDHHETVFVHIPKCAGQSVEHMFLDDLGLDWEERAPLLLRKRMAAEPGPPRLAHLLARDYVSLGYISETNFEKYFKFSVVRNPYNRVLSLYNYLNIARARSGFLKSVFGQRIAKRLSGTLPMSLDDFITEFLPQQFASADDYGEKSMYWFVRKQIDYVADVEGRLLVDQIIRLEDLKDKIEDLRLSCRLVSNIRHVNKSNTRADISRLSAKNFETIEDLYADDFDRFGYDRRSQLVG